MKDFLKFFFPAVLFFTGVGFVAGWSDRAETAANNLYAASDIVSYKNKYFISVHCGSAYTYRYSVDTDSGHFDKDKTSPEAVIHYQKTSLNKPSERHMQYVISLGTLLGGGVAEHTRRKLSELLAESKKKVHFWSWKGIKNNVFTVLGMVTGFAIGQRFASNYDVACNSDLALEILDNKEVWQQFKTKRLLATAEELLTLKNSKLSFSGAIRNPFNKDPIKLCNTSLGAHLAQLEDALNQSNPDLDSYHYAHLDNFNKRYLKASSTPAYQKLVKLTPMYHLQKNAELFSKEKFEEKHNALAKTLGFSRERWQSLCRELEQITATAG